MKKDKDIAISVKNIHKEFRLPTEKATGIKQLLINKLKHKSSYTVQKVLDGIDFEVKKGEFFGIVGRNGSGKSTLLKIIAEIYRPTSGEIKVHGKLVPFIELGVGFNPELTGRENVYLNGALLGFSEKEIDDIYEDIVDFAELRPFMDQKLKNYSSGMQVRLAFSVATRAKADILLVDEVLAVGDAEFQQKCYRYFRKLKIQGTTVIFISHSMDSVEEYCNRAMLIENGRIAYIGTAHQAAKKYLQLFGQ
jgi:ABC-2 type transport system ATP-binding protein